MGQIPNYKRLFACQPANNKKVQLTPIQQQHTTTTTTVLKKTNEEEEDEEPSTSIIPPEIKSPANQFTHNLGGYKDPND